VNALIVLATEAAEDTGGLGIVLPAIPELLWGAVCFTLLFLLIQGRAFPALNKTLAARREKIEGQIEEAEATKTEAEELRRQYEEQLAGANAQAEQILDEARQRAERLRADLVARAEEEAQQIRERARAEQQAERSRVLSELRGQVAAISTEIASKIVQAEIDPQRHAELVDRTIAELASTN